MFQSIRFHLRYVKAVSRFLPKETVKTAVVSNVISRRDTGNSLLAGICNCRKLPNSVTCGCKICILQHIQNNASRVVQQAWSQYHITPVLHEWHRLQVTQRIQFSIKFSQLLSNVCMVWNLSFSLNFFISINHQGHFVLKIRGYH